MLFTFLQAQIIFIAEHGVKVQASWETFVRFNDLLFNQCRKMHPFGLIHGMSCMETFVPEKQKTSKGQPDISAFSNIQRCSDSKIPSPTGRTGLQQGEDKVQLETSQDTKWSLSGHLGWKGPSWHRSSPAPHFMKYTAPSKTT